MNKLVILLLFITSNLIGQSFQYGIGLHSNFGYLEFDDKNSFKTVLLKPSISFNPSISLFAEIQVSKAFQFQVASQIGQKSIRLSQNLRGFNNVRFKNSISYLFLGVDLNVTARYLIEGNSKWKYFPSLGFNVGFQKEQGYVISGGINTGTFSGQGFDLDANESQSFTATNIQLGLGIRPPFTFLKRPFELNFNILYSPKKFLTYPINIGTESNPLVIQGNYHSLAISLIFYLRRLKKAS